ncbi:amino acid permease [Lactococcus nasutitermitis]|uniref:Amino acid permease n=1 Tax=Lactococcus nasutitermitis TaxID=1652957 RepID=A0ABV9JF93_9LACT|nr:amino acid permease [Lactococcus nasutitermitis]
MENSSQNKNQVKRGLKQRHLTMIALGGTIGTGLFVGSGATISQAGPLGSLVAYAVIGLMVFFLMTSLGEMASYLPLSGSFATFASRYVDKAFGFAMGWNYWFNSAITVAVEAATVGLIMKFWLPNVPSWIWSAVILALILIINLTSARAYGEAEFWMALVKVIAVIAFLAVGVLTIVGIFHQPGLSVVKNLSAGGNHGFVGGAGGMLAVLMIAGFSFQGTEIVGIAAGESENPEKTVPTAIKQVFWRIVLFYFATIFIIGALIWYKNPNLLNASETHISISPFTLIFEKAGLAAAASIMNAVILTSVISAANSWLYAASRMLYSLSLEGFAPKVFSKTRDGKGIPMTAVIVTTIIGLFAFVTSIFGPGFYTYLLAASGLSGFLAWIGIAISHYRFRRAFVKQGHSTKELGYHAKWFPVGPLLALIMSIAIALGQSYGTKNFAGGFSHWHWSAILTTYMALPLFLILYFGYKIIHHTKLIPLDEVNLDRNYK